MDKHQPLYFNPTFEETIDLIKEVRDYIQYKSSIDNSGLPVVDRLAVIEECGRITSRLTASMAWLLTERAAFEGECDIDALLSSGISSPRSGELLNSKLPLNGNLPVMLHDLLEKSHGLYTRVMRLNDMVRRAAELK